MPHVDIIGSGMAGLALGIHLQKNGFSTTIYEQHSVPGGLCTSWKRGPYTFNGCVHWVLGARSGISFYHFWKELFDIDKIPFYMPSERVVFDMPIPDRNGCKQFFFYTDIDRFEHYLLSIAPEDATEISNWCKQVRMIMPLLDYLPPAWPQQLCNKIKLTLKLTKLLPLLPFMHKWGKLTNRSYAEHFSNAFLRNAISMLYDAEMRMTVVVFAQAYAAKQVAQYPIGGSAFFASQLVDSYHACGGSLRLSTKVNSIVIVGDKAQGLILSNGERTTADFVVSAADWHWTVFSALKGKYLNKKLLQLQYPNKDEVFYSYCRLFIGVSMPMTSVPHFARIATQPITLPDGTHYDHLEVEIYNNDPTLAPEGHVAMVVNMLTREGEWWINLRQTDIKTYRETKQQLETELLLRLEQYYGTEWRNHVEVTDLATPATFFRYTSNLWGSSQGWSPRADITKRMPIRTTLPHLRNFMLCGHWTEAGGGIPVAIYSARKVALQICKQLLK